MLLPNRHGASDSYRYAFNGKEKDDEVKGEGVQYDYGFRIYDARLGRFLSMDPLFQTYPYYTPYQFAGNNPIWATDLDGLEELVTNNVRWIQNWTILDGNNKSIEGVVKVAYYDRHRGGKLVREMRESGTYVLSEGYEGGPQVIEDITLWRKAKYPKGLDEYPDYRREFDYQNRKTEIAATKPPPPPAYQPKAVVEEESVKPKIKTSTDDKTIKDVPIIKTGSTTSLIQGQFFPTIDDDGIDFKDPGTNYFPAKDKLQGIVDGVNNNKDLKTIELSGTISHGSGTSSFKARNAMVQGLNKLRTLMKEMGLRNGITIDVKINKVKSDDIDNPDSKTEINFKFLDN